MRHNAGASMGGLNSPLHVTHPLRKDSRRCVERRLWRIKLASPRIGGHPPSPEFEVVEGGAPSKKRSEKTSRFRVMTHTPLPKPPQISLIFKADTVRFHVSREKDGKLHLVRCRMGRCEGRSTGRLRASAQGGGRGKPTPHRGSDDPPSKTRTPLRPPWFFQL